MSMQEKLKSILATKAFGELSAYKEPVIWNTMSPEDRELLGLLFVKQGEHQLKDGDNKVIESFELAQKIAPKSIPVLMQQALAYATQIQNIRCLKAAETALDKITQIDPLYIEAWHSWGNILVRIGVFYEDAVYFQQANEKFAQAEQIASQMNFSLSDSFYWHWAINWYYLGKHSGEAIDFFCSLEKCREAQHRGMDSSEFHNDYANILIDLACLVNRQELFYEAAERYEKALLFATANYEVWFNLACTYQRIYEFSNDADFFAKADECFANAADREKEDLSVWLRWAELYVNAGKTLRDLDCLKMSFDKFEQAATIDPDHPKLILCWSEARILLGSFTENLEMIKNAEQHLNALTKVIPEQPDLWYVYGLCLSELGRYFSSDHYYQQSIEMFYKGLEYKPSCPALLHGIALSFFAIGELQNEAKAIETSIHYFSQVADLGGKLFPHFLSDWGVALMKLGEMTNERVHIEEAASKFETVINGHLTHLNDEDIQLEWLYHYGCAMDFLGDFYNDPIYYEKAVQVLSHIIKLDPEYIHARYNLALAFFHLGELNSDAESFRKAIHHFHEVIGYDTEDFITWNDYGMAFLNLAVISAQSEDSENSIDGGLMEHASSYFDQAEMRLQRAAALGSLPAYYNLACLYALTNQLKPAIYYLEKAEEGDALPPAEDVIHDEWLDNLRDQPAYRSLISRLLNTQDES